MLARVDIDRILSHGVPDARLTEWQLAIDALLEDHAFAARPLSLTVRWLDSGVMLVWRTPEQALATPVARESIAPHLEVYVRICRMIHGLDAEGAASPRLEALDMAKRVAHDDAAREVMSLMAEVGPDHATARRLFTLLLVLLVDTTSLDAGYHRRR